MVNDPELTVIESLFSSTTVEMLEGEMYIQDCVAYAEPPPVVRWSSSAFGPITTNTTDYVLPSSTLVVTGTTSGVYDLYCYECVAILNQVSSLYSLTAVNVVEVTQVVH